MNIINKVPWITDRELDLLKDNASLSFSLGRFDSLDDILTSLGVNVILELGDTESTDSSIKENDPKCKVKASAYYDTKLNVICIYPDKIQRKSAGHNFDELLVATFAHETMHAYFNRNGVAGCPYALQVEEPLAEFGMLLFLHETNSHYYQCVYDHVRNKKDCYRYGALLMDQHMKSGPESAERQYLERYPILLSPKSVIDEDNGILSLPAEISPSDPMSIDSPCFQPCWENVFEYPPRYYYDETTGNLFLDGYWGDVLIHDKGGIVIGGKTKLYSSDISLLYLGEHFFTDDIRHAYPICLCPVYVSPKNNVYTEVNNIPVYKKDHKPVLRSCGNGLYEICRNGKWGVIDEDFNQVIPFMYDGLGTFGRNGLMRVSIRQEDGRLLYGMINLQGEAKMPVVYDSIRINPNGTYTIRKDGKECSVDRYGKQIK